MIPEHRPEFDQLADHIKEAMGQRPAVFFINPGNWGDSLIREGAETFLRYYGIPHLVARFKDVVKKRVSVAELKAATGHADPVMIYNGCGAFSPHYQLLPLVAQLSQQFSTALFLPATFAIEADRADFAPDTHFFVRDRFQSFERMKDAVFCHDMAFFGTPVAAQPTQPSGNFFRDDAEAPEGFVPPQPNLDVSKLGRAHTRLDGFLDRIGACKHVRTNRLHVGVAATMLGRRTDIFANDYFKIKAIYDSSMADYFPNATYHQSYDDLDAGQDR